MERHFADDNEFSSVVDRLSAQVTSALSKPTQLVFEDVFDGTEEDRKLAQSLSPERCELRELCWAVNLDAPFEQWLWYLPSALRYLYLRRFDDYHPPASYDVDTGAWTDYLIFVVVCRLRLFEERLKAVGVWEDTKRALNGVARKWIVTVRVEEPQEKRRVSSPLKKSRKPS